MLLKVNFFLFFSLSFSSFGNYQLNWKCEYMKRSSWKFLQILSRFLTFTWFNKYFEWVDCYMNFLPLRTKVYSIFAFFLRRKGKSILMFVWLIGKISHSLTGIGHQVYLLKSLIFLFYTQVSTVWVCQHRDYPVIFYATVSVLWADILDFKLCILRERIKIWIFRIFTKIFEYILKDIQPS